MRSSVSTWFAHRLVWLGIAGLLAALLIAGAAFTSGALLHPRQAHAAEGCGTGSNDFYTVQKFVQGGITGGDTPGIYYVEQDTCQANATATNFANRANEKDLCASHFRWGATIFSLLGLFTSFANPIAGAGAIAGFTLGAECADTKNALTNFSNNIRATAQGCGTQGITYMMRVARNELVLYEAACQTPPEDKSLPPQDSSTLDLPLVQAPQSDSGGSICDTTPYYSSQTSDNEETSYFRDTLVANDEMNNTYQHDQWNYQTGDYDISLGTISDCATQPPPTPTDTPPTDTPTPTPTNTPTPVDTYVGTFCINSVVYRLSNGIAVDRFVYVTTRTNRNPGGTSYFLDYDQQHGSNGGWHSTLPSVASCLSFSNQRPTDYRDPGYPAP